MLNYYILAQAQCTSILLEAALKEYTADWLKNTNSVVRDETGKFAKKAASVGQEVSRAKQAIEEAIKDPEEARRKVSSELLKLTAKGLDKLLAKYPGFTNVLLDKMFGIDAQKARDKLADKYAEINPGLPNVIRPDPLKEELRDVLKKAFAHKGSPKELTKDLAQAFELVGNNYNKLIDDLNNIESESEAIKLLGKLTAMSIPIAEYLAVTLTPEVAIGLLFQEGLGTILASFAATQVANFAANKAMDELDVENPGIRLGIDLTIGLAAPQALKTGLTSVGIGNLNIATQDTIESLLQKENKIARLYKNPSFIMPSEKEFQKARLDLMTVETGSSVFYRTNIDGEKYFLKKIVRSNALEDSASREEVASKLAALMGLSNKVMPVKKVTIKDTEYIASPYLRPAKDIGTKSLRDGIKESFTQEELSKSMLFDYLVSNYDRHIGNLFWSEDGIKLIDHEYSLRSTTHYGSEITQRFMGELSDYADEMLRNKTPVKINKEDIEFVLNNKLAILDLINEGLASPKAQEDAIKTIEKNMQRLEQLFKGESIDANRLDVVRNEF
jgi:hypothetical protein